MNRETVKKVFTNIRSPVNNKKVQFTTRGILFLINLFEGKSIELVSLHCWGSKLAQAVGAFDDNGLVITDTIIPINKILIFLYGNRPCRIEGIDVVKVMDGFKLSRDSDYSEVEDAKKIVSFFD